LPSVIYDSISPGYFAAMGIPLVAGRDFADNDTAKSTAVVIVNQTLAQKFWPGENAVGKRLRTGPKNVIEIVGVAQNGKYESLGEIPKLMIYYPMTQVYDSAMALVARSSVDPASEISSLRGEVQKLDPLLPIYEAKTLRQHLKLVLFPLHAAAIAVGSFGLLAMVLAAIGIYGVMAFSVAQRTQEIGIRMALGARAIDVWKMVLKQGVIITGIGMAFGVASAIALSGMIASLLYGVSATDPQTFLFISLLLAGVALVACFLPAGRATKVDPVIAIKNL